MGGAILRPGRGDDKVQFVTMAFAVFVSIVNCNITIASKGFPSAWIHREGKESQAVFRSEQSSLSNHVSGKNYYC